MEDGLTNWSKKARQNFGNNLDVKNFDKNKKELEKLMKESK